LSIITRDMLAGRRWGEYKRNKEKKCKKEHWDKRARKEIRE
jgi:hypothetical protein